MIESRLSRNVESLNKLDRSLSKSRLSSRKSNSSREYINISRSKSTTELDRPTPRAKLLGDIASKLKGRKQSGGQLPNDSKTVAKQRLNKLENLLKDIKKCNKETNKVVYTIKKSKKH